MGSNKRKSTQPRSAKQRYVAAQHAETERLYRRQQHRKAVILGVILLALAGITALTTFILVT
ncbi:hypothetical protein [Arthrobacter sp. TMS1-12-1]